MAAPRFAATLRRAAREPGGPLPSIDVADALLELDQRLRVIVSTNAPAPAVPAIYELVVLHDEDVLKKFKAGKYAFAADAAVELVKAGGQASKGFGSGSSIYVFEDGGMLLDLAIGGQKFIFRTAALGRARTTEGALEEGTAPESGQQPQGEQEPAGTEQAQGEGAKPRRK